MRLFPAIDMKNGQCVRLTQGKFENVTVYGEDPAEVALGFERAGARYIHVVDLDGALAGQGVNTEALRKIVNTVSIPVQTGGGIRNMDHVQQKLTLGVERVIIGTAAVKNPDFIKNALHTYGAERIVAGIDASNGMVAVEGWKELSHVTAVQLGRQMYDVGLRYVVYTDISRDGMLTGANVEATRLLQQETGLTVIASGGVSGMRDLEKLADAGVYGAIIGKALYENRIDLRRAVRTFEGGTTNDSGY